MEIIESKDTPALIESIRGEVAKANSEIKCARQDLEKAQQRLNFVGIILNELITRKGN